MDKLDKINEVVSKLDLYIMNDGKLIDHEDVVEIVVESALQWGEIILQERTKEGYIAFLLDSRVLEKVNESTYRFHGERWECTRVTVEAALNAKPLSMKQSLAVDLIAAGATDAEVAQQIEVNRVTVWRWRTSCRSFIAQLAMAKQDRQDRVETIAPEAD